MTVPRIVSRGIAGSRPNGSDAYAFFDQLVHRRRGSGGIDRSPRPRSDRALCALFRIGLPCNKASTI